MEAVLDVAWASNCQLLVSTGRKGEAIMWDLREDSSHITDEREEAHSTGWLLQDASSEHGAFTKRGEERPGPIPEPKEPEPHVTVAHLCRHNGVHIATGNQAGELKIWDGSFGGIAEMGSVSVFSNEGINVISSAGPEAGEGLYSVLAVGGTRGKVKLVKAEGSQGGLEVLCGVGEYQDIIYTLGFHANILVVGVGDGTASVFELSQMDFEDKNPVPELVWQGKVAISSVRCLACGSSSLMVGIADGSARLVPFKQEDATDKYAASVVAPTRTMSEIEMRTLSDSGVHCERNIESVQSERSLGALEIYPDLPTEEH